MHHAIWLAGLLGLIAFAFGEACAVILARFLIYAALTAALLLALDVLTHGRLSDLI
jgi:hypothetical protein